MAQCIGPNCTREAVANMLCHAHNKQIRRGKFEELKQAPAHLVVDNPLKDLDNPNKICLGPLCDRPVVAQNLCTSHFKQLSRGQELKPLRVRGNAEERFWRYVNKETESGCWEWIGSLKDGYGQFIVSANNVIYTHRYAYELVHNTTLTKDQSLDHLCRNRKCCNPEHLQVVSARENTKRMLSYKAMSSEISRLRLILIDNGIYPGPSILDKLT